MYTVRYKSHHDASRALKERFYDGADKKEYVAELLNSSAATPRAIYLHVPFCNKVCSFCPFHRPDELKRREYDKYLINEIEKLASFGYMQAPIDAVNFGGGTPTSLMPEQMSRVLESLRKNFNIRENAEVSVETSATELTQEMREALKEGGVNRLSIGVQTFDDSGRKLLGRRGSGIFAYERVAAAKKTFENVGIDLIYNYPDENLQTLENDLKLISELNLAGVSFYSLMLYEKTPLYNKISREQREQLFNVERDKAFFDLIMQTLQKEGYEVFELTKLIRDNLDRYLYMRIRHEGGSCIAIGSGAGGNLNRYVYRNGVNMQTLGEDIPISSMGRLLKEEYFILDEFINELQKTSVDIGEYSKRLKIDLFAVIRKPLEKMQKEGLVSVNGTIITLTHDGIYWGNNVIDEFVRSIVKTR